MKRLALILVLGVGCGGPPSDSRVTVHYWEKWTGFEGDAMQAVVDDFNASQDRIVVKKLTVSQIDRKLMLATAGGNPPDLAGLWSHTLPDFSEKGALTPLNKFVEDAGISSNEYIPVLWDLCWHRGFIWGLPTTPATIALHWNKRLFREAGIDHPPATLDELDAMNDRLTIVELHGKRLRFSDLTETDRREKAFKLVQVGHLPTVPGWWITMWGYWFGGNLWDGDRRITGNSPENQAAYDWLGKHAEKFGVDNLRSFGASLGNFSSPQDAFLSGKVAMVLQGVWMYNFIEKFAPQLEWSVAPFPSKTGEPVTIAECDMLVIPKGAQHPREAFEFIRYVNSQGPMEKLCLGHRKFSARAEVSPDFIAKHPNPFIQVFIELAQSPNARYVPRFSIWQEYRDEMQVAADRVLALEATAPVALAQAQERVQWKFDRIMRRWDIVKAERIHEWSGDDPR